MITLLQRVRCATVHVEDKAVATITKGILAYIAIQPDDDAKTTERVAQRIAGYRIFSDQDGKMNLCVSDIDGAILAVPQFTLAADTQKGRRPSFSHTALPDDAQRLFDTFVTQLRTYHKNVVCGQFQANMQVESINDGPATFILSSRTAS